MMRATASFEQHLHLECWRFPSSHCQKKHGRSGSRAPAWRGRWSECSTECEWPPGREILLWSVSIQHYILTRVTVSYLFEADAGEVPQDSFHRFGQLPLAQRILLSPDNVNVVWDVIGGVVSRFALALTLKPWADVVGRPGVSCRWNVCIYGAVTLSVVHSNVHDVSSVTHVPGANKHCDHVWFRLFRVFVLHLLKQLAETLPFLGKKILLSISSIFNNLSFILSNVFVS